MFRLLNRMCPKDLNGYRLVGGTALAMYINHRKSMYFDFFSDNEVRRMDLQKFDWLDNSEFRGETGMVDVVVRGRSRNVMLNFVDGELFGNLMPVYPPILTRGGIPVAHPVDVLVGKLSALSRRQEARDYVDIAAASRSLPEQLEEAMRVHIKSPEAKESSRLDMAKTLQDYPFELEHTLEKADLESLATLAESLMSRAKDSSGRDRGNEWDFDR